MKKYDIRDTESFKRCIENPEVYRESIKFQNFLAQHGIAWHNTFSNECTEDFSCCEGDGQYKTYLPSYYNFAKTIFEELFQKIKHGDMEHQMWLENEMKSFLDELYQTL